MHHRCRCETMSIQLIFPSHFAEIAMNSTLTRLGLLASQVQRMIEKSKTDIYRENKHNIWLGSLPEVWKRFRHLCPTNITATMLVCELLVQHLSHLT